ncbi:TPA: glycosyltransferase family 4 protein [Stenotrophomonas maltophilia]|uniref:glycosyltransferase family 4 protein n=1 Tax=Stenotrophomonas maltophilia TaxID=40324 RepID=UPI0008DD6652|nr:glycosyltransferase family 4 protein [Stenotrophomonas maltophilia]OHY65047.1 hypothetical protein BB780_16845 [Stenotrophomonas maltophilia]HEL4844254.1 glycosyltransferase family 4 protein [Stenotrophomonas maltophilia]HEL4847858.1 glycosyltransferase family 4 protein [Stenotrophomonas maltophilia]
MKMLAVHQSSEMYGSDRSFLSAIEAIIENAGSPLQVCVVLPDEGPLTEHLRSIGANVDLVPDGYLRRSELRSPLRFLAALWRGVTALRRKLGGGDVIYVNTLVCVSAILSGGMFSKRLIVHVREIPRPLEAVFFRVLLRICRAELVFNSNATRKALGLDGRVLYNGVDSPQDYVSAAACKRRSADQLRILVIGRINAWKGQGLLLDAAAILEREVSIRIVGSSIPSQLHIVDELRAQARDLPDNVNVEFFEFCDDPGMHYRWADYVVVPSTRPEPFGRVAIEGMSFGKPVVAAAHGGLLEIITDGASGCLFDPGSVQSLATVLRHLPEHGSDGYCAMSSAAREAFMSHFSVESYAREVRELFKEFGATACLEQS